MSLRIVVADDHEIVRRGVTALLESHAGWEIAAEARAGLEVVHKAIELKPDVLILDITLPGLSGLEAARRIRKALPQVEVLVLTVHDLEQMVREALDAGDRGYVLKSDAGRDVLAAVEAVRHQRFFFSPKIHPHARIPFDVLRIDCPESFDPRSDVAGARDSQAPGGRKAHEGSGCGPRDCRQDRRNRPDKHHA